MKRAYPLTLVSLLAISSWGMAGWRESVDYDKLLIYTSLTSPLPNGAINKVCMAEADTYGDNPNDNIRYMPNPGLSYFSGKTISDASGIHNTADYSGHAATVGSFFFGNANSLSPTTNSISVYEANDFINSVYGGFPIGASPDGVVMSHAYIATNGQIPEDQRTIFNGIITRFDYLSATSNIIHVIGMNNGNSGAIPPVWGSAYNTISVGRSDGLHSHGFTDSDFINSGRQKPDIVAPSTATSYSTGCVAGAAKLIYDKASTNGSTGAIHQDTIKAVLLTGATKSEFPKWSQTSTQPLDTTYGTGELNILNSYRIIETNGTATGNVGNRGWARNSITANGQGTTRSYTFTTPNHSASPLSLSSTLIWQRQVTAPGITNNFTYTYQPLANLKLELQDSGGNTIQTSNSALDNVEHIWRTSLQPNTSYTLKVSSDSGTSDFSLAWNVDYQPHVSTDIVKSANQVNITFGNLIPDTTLPYTIQRSTTLSATAWTNQTTASPTGSSINYTDSSPPAGGKSFYRIIYFLP